MPATPACFGPCLKELRAEIAGRRILAPVEIPVLSREPGFHVANGPSGADILVLTGEALVRERDGELGEGAPEREVLLLGPSTAGVASLLNLPHWCPYGR
jgi:hypothetical protein